MDFGKMKTYFDKLNVGDPPGVTINNNSFEIRIE
jgi:hypothetical protein